MCLLAWARIDERLERLSPALKEPMQTERVLRYPRALAQQTAG